MYKKSICFLFFSIVIAFCCSCKKSFTPSVSFYYWKTKFALNKQELDAIKNNHVSQLYVRYFDVEYNKDIHKALPVGMIQFSEPVKTQKLIPVIYIKNEVFLQTGITAIDTLCQNVMQLTKQINKAAGQQPDAVQFDCDWSVNSKDKYFQFLKKYKAISHQHISATIRLHQVKYALTTGVPPVDKGILMFYNMGQIDPSNNNSIYTENTAISYLGKLKEYPLPLDVALPIFSWGIQIREGKVIHLLNKMNAGHFNKDSCFQLIREDRFKAIKSCFKGGYYFLQNDEIKIEAIRPDDLKSMAKLINKNSKQTIHQILFYDLDSFNLKNYETNVYEQTANLFN